jgi:hypothetical protein
MFTKQISNIPPQGLDTVDMLEGLPYFPDENSGLAIRWIVSVREGQASVNDNDRRLQEKLYGMPAQVVDW